MKKAASSAVAIPLDDVTNLLLPIRVTPEQEAMGLDLSQHGEFMELAPMRQFGHLDVAAGGSVHALRRLCSVHVRAPIVGACVR